MKKIILSLVLSVSSVSSWAFFPPSVLMEAQDFISYMRTHYCNTSLRETGNPSIVILDFLASDTFFLSKDVEGMKELVNAVAGMCPPKVNQKQTKD